MKKIVLVALSMGIFLASCTEKSDMKSKIEKNETKKIVREQLVIAQEGEPKILDVHSGNDGFSLRINRQIYSRLVEADSDMKIHPGLAESWKNIDDKITQFKIRKGVKFHNGDEVKAEDVKFSFERMMESPRIAFVLPPIEKVEIVDEYTINIVTKTPFGPLLAHLSHPALGIINKKVFIENRDNKDNPNGNIVGTGPYKFVEWKSGEKVVLERNDEYFKGLPNFKNMVFRNIVEANSRTIALETGEVDIALEIGAVDKKRVIENPRLNLYTKPSVSFTYVGFNNEKAPFNDERVRKAINYAVDKQAIIDVVLSGGGIIATSPIAPTVFGFSDKTKPYELDIEKAKGLMDEAGLENGFSTSIHILGGEAERQTAEIIQSDLKKIGIDMKILVTENSGYWEITSKGNHEMFLGAWGSVTGDADYGLYPMYHSKAKGLAGNRTFYSNEKVDLLLEQARTTIDQEKRKELYEEIQKNIVEDAPNLMLYYRDLAVGTQKDIGGFKIYPIPLHDFSTVHIISE